jgi:hypothetical protein
MMPEIKRENPIVIQKIRDFLIFSISTGKDADIRNFIAGPR